jgi:hypothetical protein
MGRLVIEVGQASEGKGLNSSWLSIFFSICCLKDRHVNLCKYQPLQLCQFNSHGRECLDEWKPNSLVPWLPTIFCMSCLEDRHLNLCKYQLLQQFISHCNYCLDENKYISRLVFNFSLFLETIFIINLISLALAMMYS